MELKGKATVIGSWPFTNVEESVELILKYLPDIPAWAQHPKLNFFENMYVQYSEGLPCLAIDIEKEKIHFETSGDILGPIQVVYENFLAENHAHFAITEKYAQGLHAFVNKVKSMDKKLNIVKGQSLGPISFCLTLTDENKKTILYNEQLADAIIKSTVCKTVWQAEFLKTIAEKVIIFIDEPYLAGFGSAYINLTEEKAVSMMNEVSDKLHSIDTLTGVHCCGNTDWSLLAKTNIDIINFDAYEFFDNLLLYPEAMGNFMDKGGYLAWGIVPTSKEKADIETVDSLFDKLSEQQERLSRKGIDINLIREKTIITPSCGTGSLPDETGKKILILLSELSEKLKLLKSPAIRTIRIIIQIVSYAFVLFICCVVCHSELYLRKPIPRYLTSFYLMLAVGGAVGGIFVNLIAPVIFKGFWEYHVGLLYCVSTLS